MLKKNIVEGVKILGDRHVVESVIEKAFEFDLSVLQDNIIHLESHRGSKLFLNWLVHCGISYEVVEKQLAEYGHRFPERIALALGIGTYGRKAYGID